ncbi:hypothetical protein [Sulfuricella sp. T08]|uniref:hypothetical protein n=1 Tax=Sulfuricella sp. T08 TaxID=1632857 RepID=UPI0007519999|nr:hypothetical protein [Sulfuricella sp. T08]
MRHEQFEKFIVAIEAEGLLLVVDPAIMSIEIPHAGIHEAHDVHFWTLVARQDKTKRLRTRLRVFFMSGQPFANSFSWFIQPMGRKTCAP